MTEQIQKSTILYDYFHQTIVMEEESGVYIFDDGEKYKENSFTANYKQEQEHDEPQSYNVQTPKCIFQKQHDEELDEEKNDQENQQDQEDQQSQESQEQDDDQKQNAESSVRREYIASKIKQKFEEKNKKKSKASFYQLTKLSVEGNLKQIMNVTNMNEFMLNPLHPHLILQCTMIKTKQNLLNYSWQIYTQNRFLMSAQRVISSTSKYKVYSNKSNSQNNYVGKIQSNFMGTQWFIFDAGVNADRSRDLQKVRKMLGSVNYQFNLLGKKGPRKMQVHLPSVNTTHMKHFSCLENTNMLKSLYQKQSNIVSKYTNKQPQYDQQNQCYKLNFNGKVKTASVKNFILIDEQQEKECLLFGKISEDLYYVQMKYPLSPIQALGLCISSVDRKLGVE